MVGLGVILAIVTLPSVIVFFVAYQRVRDALGVSDADRVPAATIVAGPARFTHGRAVQRIARRIPAIQAGLVSFAIASIAFMVMSIVAMAALALSS